MEFTDQIGRGISISKPIKRIVSLVPSITELVVFLGLEEKLVGITKFCVHPSNLKTSKTIVGGTKKVHLDKIRDLKPDIILCNKEENTLQMVLELEKIAPVHVSNVISFHDSQALIQSYGDIFDCDIAAERLNLDLKEKYEGFKFNISKTKLKVAYFIWREPWMVVGADTFINSMLELNGWENSFTIFNGRYPEINMNNLNEIDLDLILLSSEPFPFKQKHIKELRNYTKARVEIVEGEFFSWYGSRSLIAFDYFKQFQNYLSIPL
tara:strand:- start:977 stop:1774 length:798 start_codon:yes stop_codon:yes gene_type:complete